VLGRLTQEWQHVSVKGYLLPLAEGRTPQHILVLDFATGEGALLKHGGMAKADLDKHRI
jgi:hypothetical protein